MASDRSPLVPWDSVVAEFSVPLDKAARNLGIGSTALKRICREHGIARWPYRKVGLFSFLFFQIMDTNVLYNSYTALTVKSLSKRVL